MGLMMSILELCWPIPVIITYKCPPQECDTSYPYLDEEGPFIVLSTPNAVIYTVEESDY